MAITSLSKHEDLDPVDDEEYADYLEDEYDELDFDHPVEDRRYEGFVEPSYEWEDEEEVTLN